MCRINSCQQAASCRVQPVHLVLGGLGQGWATGGMHPSLPLAAALLYFLWAALYRCRVLGAGAGSKALVCVYTEP